jgi:APA family basic amino acid/polyamine antiporter
MENTPSRLARRLNVTDAVVVGLGAMIGAGVFASVGPAAAAAGSWLLAGLLIAGAIALLNAATMAQLAAVYPESGGTYVYGRRLLGPVAGFLAGWGFVIGKLASCAAMALTFGYYASPAYGRELGVALVLALTAVNCMGVAKTARVMRILLAVVLASLAVVAFAALAGGGAETARLKFWETPASARGILQSAGLLFFAFAGYARVATLGEEVADPRRNIPRAIAAALGITFAVYFVIVFAALLSVDAGALAASKSPLVLAVQSGKYAALSPAVRLGACFASAGVLISLLAGVSRTTFAMAANGDLPRALSAVHAVRKVPYRAEIAVGLIVAAAAGLADLRSAIGFSSFSVLIYYAIANAAALKLPSGRRLWPKWTSALGLLACLTVAASLPWRSVAGGLALFVIGLAFRRSAILLCARRAHESPR